MKIAGIVAYVGSPYAGFQRQKKGNAVQNEIETALSFLLNEETTIKAAGRTDAGVSAEGQVISFESKRKLDLAVFRMHLNRLLPNSISVLSLCEVDESFDPRHSAIEKEYIYRFYLGEKDPFKKDTYAHFREQNFNFERFKAVLEGFLGKHDFSSFTSKVEDKDDFIRVIENIDLVYDPLLKVGSILFVSNGFMTYQIRFMVGMALDAAYGKKTVEEVLSYLDRVPRKIVSSKAPPEGLCLRKVIYEKKLGL